MFLAGDFGLIRDVLTGLEVRQEKIDEIMVMLGEHSDTLQGTEVTEVPATWFGGSPTGHHRLGSNAAMARDEVRKEFLAMAEGLRGIPREKTRRTTIGDGAETERPEDLVARKFVATAPNQRWVARAEGGRVLAA